MTLPPPATLHAAMGATWPPESQRMLGPFVIREGRGGGSRVSAATATGPISAEDLPPAEAAMRDLGQRPLFMVREDDVAFDALLDAQGYAVMDPVVLYAAPVATLTAGPGQPADCDAIWPPLSAQRHIWAAAGIGPERIAIMDRVTGPRTTLVGRLDGAPAGAAFVARHDTLGMLHALEVSEDHRRRGIGAALLRAAAVWAGDHGAGHLSLAVTEANRGARQLYAGAGMVPVARYHYRIRPT